MNFLSNNNFKKFLYKDNIMQKSLICGTDQGGVRTFNMCIPQYL